MLIVKNKLDRRLNAESHSFVINMQKKFSIEKLRQELYLIKCKTTDWFTILEQQTDIVNLF